MKFTSEDYEYLYGDKFSNGYNLVLKNNLLYDRIEFIKRITKGKSVLHIGCCDHIPLIQSKIENNTWLQKILDDNCSEVVGIDISDESVKYVNENHFAKNEVYCVDVTDRGSIGKLPKREFDYVLLGEILEHVDNPVQFLTEMNNNLSEYGFKGEYVITVPNAFSLQRFGYRRGIECINTDHKYWFTPFTLAKVLVDANIKPLEVFFVNHGSGGNGKNLFSDYMYIILEKVRRRPSAHASYRGSQLVIVGKSE